MLTENQFYHETLRILMLVGVLKITTSRPVFLPMCQAFQSEGLVVVSTVYLILTKLPKINHKVSLFSSFKNSITFFRIILT